MSDILTWRDISTAPMDGTRFLAKAEDFVFITAYLPKQCAGFGVVDSCCGYYEDMKPSLWTPLP